MDELFSKNTWEKIFDSCVRRASHEVDKLNLAQLTSADAPKFLDNIASRSSYDVVKFGKPESGSRRPGLGKQQGEIHVEVPFEGADSSLHLTPTSGRPVKVSAYLKSNNRIVLCIPDDDTGPTILNQVLKEISRMLDLQRADVERSMPALRSKIESAAVARIALLEAQKKRDEEFGFKIA